MLSNLGCRHRHRCRFSGLETSLSRPTNDSSCASGKARCRFGAPVEASRLCHRNGSNRIRHERTPEILRRIPLNIFNYGFGFGGLKSLFFELLQENRVRWTKRTRLACPCSPINASSCQRARHEPKLWKLMTLVSSSSFSWQS